MLPTSYRLWEMDECVKKKSKFPSKYLTLLNKGIPSSFQMAAPLNSHMYINFLQEELPILLENVPLDPRQQMMFQQGGARQTPGNSCNLLSI